MALERESTFDNYATEKVDVSKNALLGDYNAKGEYVIARNIMKELVVLNKTRVNSYTNSVYCVTRLKNFGILNFEVKFSKDELKNEAVAELFLMENVNKIKGLYSNTIRTKIARYTSKVSEKFAVTALAMFNVLIDENKGQEREEEELDVNAKYITARIKFTEELSKLTERDYEKAYEKYYNQRIELLKSISGAYGEEVLNEFAKEYNTIDNFFKINKDPNKYKHLNELLDKTIELISAKQKTANKGESAYKTNIQEYMNKFSEEVHNKQEEAVDKFVGSKYSDAILDTVKDRADTLKNSTPADSVQIVQSTADTSNITKNTIIKSINTEKIIEYLDEKKSDELSNERRSVFYDYKTELEIKKKQELQKEDEEIEEFIKENTVKSKTADKTNAFEKTNEPVTKKEQEVMLSNLFETDVALDKINDKAITQDKGMGSR